MKYENAQLDLNYFPAGFQLLLILNPFWLPIKMKYFLKVDSVVDLASKRTSDVTYLFLV